MRNYFYYYAKLIEKGKQVKLTWSTLRKSRSYLEYFD